MRLRDFLLLQLSYFINQNKKIPLLPTAASSSHPTARNGSCDHPQLQEGLVDEYWP